MIHTGESVDDEPYIFASEAQPVYYVDDETNKDWSIAIPLKPRDLFDMGEYGESQLCEHALHREQDIDILFPFDNEAIHLAQNDIDEELIALGDLENDPLDVDDVNMQA